LDNNAVQQLQKTLRNGLIGKRQIELVVRTMERSEQAAFAAGTMNAEGNFCGKTE